MNFGIRTSAALFLKVADLKQYTTSAAAEDFDEARRAGRLCGRGFTARRGRPV